jgi:glyoxalase family protein
VHHVAWASHDEDHERWRERVIAAGAHPTPVIDRFWFRSIYFREPSGVLFELATFSPGFAADESPDHLGEKLVLPPWLESRREEIEARLTPIENPRKVTA